MTSADEASPATFAAKGNVRVLTDDGRDVAPGSDEDGVLAVAGRLPLGYHNDPDATACMFRQVEGVRYATQATAPGPAPTAASSSWAVVRRASTPAARRCTPKRWNRRCVASRGGGCCSGRRHRCTLGEMVTALVEVADGESLAGDGASWRRAARMLYGTSPATRCPSAASRSRPSPAPSPANPTIGRCVHSRWSWRRR